MPGRCPESATAWSPMGTSYRLSGVLEGKMATVMIRCPRTGSAVSTQIGAEAADFERLPSVAARLHCPACGEEHIWTPSVAWLTDNPLVPEPAKQTTVPEKQS